jgi:hypothetical protein
MKTTYTATDPAGKTHTFTTSRKVHYVAFLHMLNGVYGSFWRKTIDGAKRELAGRSPKDYGTAHSIVKARGL